MATSSDKVVWVFHATGALFAGGVWSSLEAAEKCIAKHRLSGTLTAYPIDECCFDWAVRKRCTGLKVGVVEEKSRDPAFIGRFTSAAQDHFDYADGKKV